MQDTETALCIL